MNTPIMERRYENVTTNGDVVETETVQKEGEVEADTGLMYMNLNAEGQVDGSGGELKEAEAAWEGEEGEEEARKRTPPREVVMDRRTSRRAKREQEKLERDRERQTERERKQRERREEKERKLKEKSKSPPPDSPALPAREKLTNGMSKEEDEKYDENMMNASEVIVMKHPTQITACGQTIDVVFDTSNAGEGSLTAVCKGTKNTVVDTRVSEEDSGQYRVQFTPNMADVFMLSVRWEGCDVPGSPFLINLNLLLPAPCGEENKNVVAEKTMMIDQSEDNAGKEEAIADQLENRTGQSKDSAEEKVDEAVGSEQDVRTKQEPMKPNSREMREKNPAIIVSDEDPFDMAYEASRMLGKCLSSQTDSIRSF